MLYELLVFLVAAFEVSLIETMVHVSIDQETTAVPQLGPLNASFTNAVLLHPCSSDH